MLSLVLLLLNEACVTTAVTPTKPIPLEILQKLEASGSKRKTVSGTGFISIKNEHQNISAPGVLLVEWPDKIRLEAHDPMGTALAILVVHGDRFWWYSRSEPSIVTGATIYLKNIVGMDVDAQEFVSQLLPRFFFDRFQVGTGKQAVMKKGKDTITIQWSDRLWEVEEWTKVSDDKKSRIQYENYSVKFGLSYPQKIRMTSYLGKQELQNLTWSWKDWQPELSKNENLFLVPQSESFGKPTKALP